MGLGGRALQPLGRLTKSTHAGSWSYRSSPPSRLASRHHDDTDPGFGLVARKCQLYRRLYMRTDPVQDGCHLTRQPGSDTVRTKDRLRRALRRLGCSDCFVCFIVHGIASLRKLLRRVCCTISTPQQSELDMTTAKSDFFLRANTFCTWLAELQCHHMTCKPALCHN